MRMVITASLETPEGVPMLGFHRDELVFPEGEGEEGMAATVTKVSTRILDGLDEAKERIGEQVAAVNQGMTGG